MTTQAPGPRDDSEPGKPSGAGLAGDGFSGGGLSGDWVADGWVLDDAALNVALGGRIRAARKAAGLSRPELVARLPFPCTVATLWNWETGKRAVSHAKLVELARALHTTAPDLMEEAIESLDEITALMVVVDLRPLAVDTTPEFGMLASWAASKLAQTGVPVIRVHHTVLREFAVLHQVPVTDLMAHVTQTRAAFGHQPPPATAVAEETNG